MADQDTMPRVGAHPLALTAPVAPPYVGVLYRIRKKLRTATAPVIAASGSGVELVYPTGELSRSGFDRLQEPVWAPNEAVRSRAGRVLQLANAPAAKTELSQRAYDAVARLSATLCSDPNEAIGLLLDSSALGLSVDDLLALPIDAWRVRYELLRVAEGEEAARLAREIARDDDAPTEVRVLVSLQFRLPVDYTSAAADMSELFQSGIDSKHDVDLTRAARESGEYLRRAGVDIPFRLGDPIDPDPVNEPISVAGLLKALEQPDRVSPPIKLDSKIPLSMIDDLLDRNVAVHHVDPAASISLRGDGKSVPVRDYLTARRAPTSLSLEAVSALEFYGEAERRAILGNDSALQILEEASRHRVNQYRDLAQGRVPEDQSGLPHVAREFIACLSSGSAADASKTLLADRSIWPLLAELDQPTTPQSAEATTIAEAAALRRARAHLYEWDLDAAKQVARDALRFARKESTRDELLNTLACVAWLYGEYEPALAALENALEGEYTEALLTNTAVVASALAPAKALPHFVRMAKEAPNAEMRAMAAERALVVWHIDAEQMLSDDLDSLELPEAIRNSLRPLVKERLPSDRYVRLLRTLAVHDDAWLSARAHTDFGPNANTAAVRLFQARATGVVEFAQALSAEFQRGKPEEWVVDERDSMVGTAIELLVDDISSLGAGMFGMTVLDSGMPMATDKAIALTSLTIAAVCRNIDPEEGEPKSDFVDRLERARSQLSSLGSTDRDRVEPIYRIGANSLGVSIALARNHELEAVYDAANRLAQMLQSTPRRRINFSAVAEMTHPMMHFCNETNSLLGRLRELVTDQDVLELIDGVTEDNVRVWRGLEAMR